MHSLTCLFICNLFADGKCWPTMTLFFLSWWISAGEVNWRRREMSEMVKLIGLLGLLSLITFCFGKTESQLRLGKAINIFIRYGYLSISMKVISYNDTETWLFKEPTKNIFTVSPFLSFSHIVKPTRRIQKNWPGCADGRVSRASRNQPLRRSRVSSTGTSTWSSATTRDNSFRPTSATSPLNVSIVPGVLSRVVGIQTLLHENWASTPLSSTETTATSSCEYRGFARVPVSGSPFRRIRCWTLTSQLESRASRQATQRQPYNLWINSAHTISIVTWPETHSIRWGNHLLYLAQCLWRWRSKRRQMA